jgi:ABC-type multidrug transport system ATPase subunit
MTSVTCSVLLYRTSGVAGFITVNGVERKTEQFRRQSCYITQDCYLLDLLTTRETLAVAASFKLNPKVTTREKNDMVRYNNNNSVALVRERTIPTQRPPLVGEASANFRG